MGTNRSIRVGKRSVFVNLVLEYVGVDRSGLDPVSSAPGRDLLRAPDPLGKIPQNMKGDRRANTRHPMHFGGITEFLLCGRSRGRLQEFSEPSSGIGEPPGRNLNAECFQSLEYSSACR